jgi:biopolymer transport protein ExbB
MGRSGTPGGPLDARGVCAMRVHEIIAAFGYVIYAALGLLAIWGVYNAILLYRSLGKKSIGDGAGVLLQQVSELTRAGKFDAAVTVAQNPPYWHTALAQLVAVALKNRSKGLAKIKQVLVMEFHTEVIGAMENRLASLSTIVRMGPLLGLLGTVVHAKLRRLRDRTERQLQDFLEVLEQIEAHQSGGRPSRSGTVRAVLPR